MKNPTRSISRPWWSYGHLWLVISGPLLVVVASVISAVVAFQGDDTALQDDPAAIRAARIQQMNKDQGMAPALQARNHAAGLAVQQAQH